MILASLAALKRCLDTNVAAWLGGRKCSDCTGEMGRGQFSIFGAVEEKVCMDLLE